MHKIVFYYKHFYNFTFCSQSEQKFGSRKKPGIQFAHVWAIYFCARVRMFCSWAKRGSKFSHECTNSWWNWKNACNIIFFIIVFQVNIEYFFDDKIEKNHKKFLFLYSNIIINNFFKKKIEISNFLFFVHCNAQNSIFALCKEKKFKISKFLKHP